MKRRGYIWLCRQDGETFCGEAVKITNAGMCGLMRRHDGSEVHVWAENMIRRVA